MTLPAQAPAGTRTAIVWHNETEDADGRPAYCRMRHQPKVASGDRLVRVVDLPLEVLGLDEEATDDDIAHAVFAAGNAPYDTPAVTAYRAAHVRSLCIGDVVQIANTFLGCEPIGWQVLEPGLVECLQLQDKA